ncbi:stress response translation initiation inhibitor YciH [Shewanella xiamenensis]|jgi:translation initiation factor 1|uniref:Stress response translation initiation inhibitor YciH n=1 Tax=Shewanella xiamenensis TaxID=332186 RepID=A0AAE4Q1N9_9GAMM|nr:MULTISPECIES: stress response translation initiation inhibitor YciH [Shewanella]KEK27679.1 translation initiation factor Sui1 [Shewanella xiamenensis]KPN76846.1 translation initiation factor Sui1 [Shewanella sp. Sh95]MBW0278091.1 translation initiation factor [Shewanella xiamenensis]MBW0294826.1 translation initiation factor [Shewanella xiamenensis]MCD8552163.1 stress response translation initiation inhibitor YciH [Shewanella xiamenensis]
MRVDPNVSLVYSTDKGRITAEPEAKALPASDGIVRIHRDSKGRKGKGVSVISGLGLDDTGLKALAQTLKKQCGCGGTVKDFTIEVQTDNRELLKQLLEKQNYKVKLAGG